MKLYLVHLAGLLRMKRLATLLAATAVLTLSAPISRAQEKPESIPLAINSFEFLGCGGDWPSDDSSFATIRRLTSQGNVTYLVRHPSACGLVGRKPTASLVAGELHIGYELYSPTDVAIMCECEYWAKFTFGPAMMMNSKVKFEGLPTTLVGNNWPGER